MSIADYIEAQRERLATLPYFDSDAPARITAAWGDGDIEELFGDALHGGPPIDRHIGLDYLAATERTDEVVELDELAVDEDDVAIYLGSLEVAGNLEVRGVLVVLGELRVGGAVVLYGGDNPALYAGGIRCRDYLARTAETVALDELTAERNAILIYNHTITVAKKIRAAVLITDDAAVDAEIEADRRSDGSHDDYRALFDLDFDDSADDFDSEEAIHEPLVAVFLGKT